MTDPYSAVFPFQHRRDALNRTGRPIYYSICEIAAVEQTQTVLDSPSSCGRKQAYSSLQVSSQSSDFSWEMGKESSLCMAWIEGARVGHNFFGGFLGVD